MKKKKIFCVRKPAKWLTVTSMPRHYGCQREARNNAQLHLNNEAARSEPCDVVSSPIAILDIGNGLSGPRRREDDVIAGEDALLCRWAGDGRRGDGIKRKAAHCARRLHVAHTQVNFLSAIVVDPFTLLLFGPGITLIILQSVYIAIRRLNLFPKSRIPAS